MNDYKKILKKVRGGGKTHPYSHFSPVGDNSQLSLFMREMD